MHKITFKYNQDIAGKKDLIKKEVNINYQIGNTNNSDELQAYNALNSITYSYYDFMTRVGFEPVSVFLHAKKIFDESQQEIAPEDNFVPADDQLNYDSFVKRFRDSEEFRQKQFEIFQLFMSDED